MDNLRPVPGTNLPERYRVIVESILKTESVLQSGNERASYSYEEMVDKVVTARNKTVSREGCEALLRRGAERIAGTDRYRFTHDIRTNVPKPFRMISAEQSEQMGSQIKCPVCMIKGDPGEDYEPREEFVKYVENLRKTSASPVEYHTVPGTHHFHLNTPELVAPIINKFLIS
jgi:pimeloyl-ACP methyl ester carboxylesterase